MLVRQTTVERSHAICPETLKANEKADNLISSGQDDAGRARYVPFKASAERRHPVPKQRYRARTSAAYEAQTAITMRNRHLQTMAERGRMVRQKSRVRPCPEYVRLP